MFFHLFFSQKNKRINFEGQLNKDCAVRVWNYAIYSLIFIKTY